VNDPLPSGLVFVSATPSQGLYDPRTGRWTVGTVNARARATLLLNVMVVSLDPQTNAAKITHVDQFDPVPANNIDGIVVLAMPVTPPPVTAPPAVTSLQRFGYHAQPTLFVLTFSSALDPARAQNVHNYTLTPIGPHGRLGREIRIVSAVYNPVAQTVTLHPAIRVYLFQPYRLVVNGMAPDGLASPSGTLLDGAGNGIPGSNYVRVFGRGILAGANRAVSQRGHVLDHQSQPGHPRAVAHSRLHAAHRAPAGASHGAGVPSIARVADVGLNPAAVDAALESLMVPPQRR
jgi:hypothetical protein